MKKVIFRGPILTRSGYGEQARFALRSLLSRPDLYDIYIEPRTWGKTNWIFEDTAEKKLIDSLIRKRFMYKGEFDVSMQVTIPNEWEPLAPINVGYTAGIETTKVAPQWLEKANMMDNIIVVSNHSKTVFENTRYDVVDRATGQKVSGYACNTNITAVQYPVRDIEPVQIDLDKVDTDFNFLCVAQMGPRKNVLNTIKWFVEEFKDEADVGLVLKISKANNSVGDRIETKNVLRTFLNTLPDRKCSVYMVHGNLSDEEMTGLYENEKIHSFVTLTHGEGYGLPIFEAAIAGLPVIAPAWSGQNDFLYMSDTNEVSGKSKLTPMFTKVSYELNHIPKEAVWDGVLQADSMWCYPKEKSAKKAMRNAITARNHNEKVASKLSKKLKEKFTEEIMYERFCSVFGEGLSDNEETPQVVMV